MPLYEFEERATGRRVELFRAIAERDLAPDGFKRVVCGMPAIVKAAHVGGLYTGRAQDPGSAVLAVPRALKELEEKHSADRIARDAGFSVRTLQETWLGEQGEGSKC